MAKTEAPRTAASALVRVRKKETVMKAWRTEESVAVWLCLIMCLHTCKVTRCLCCSVRLTSQDRMPDSTLVKEHVLEDLRVRREENGYAQPTTTTTAAATTATPLLPSTRACWREPCNNPPCFHDNHLLLSSPHLSLAPSLFRLPPSLLSSLSVFSLPSAHCWYFKVKEGHSQIARYRER